MGVDWGFIQKTVASFHYSVSLHDMDFVKEMVSCIVLFKATSVVETGTELGNTSSFLATVFPSLVIYTCDRFTQRPTMFEQFQNIVFESIDSRQFIPKLGVEQLGSRPFYYLDAHRRGHRNPIVAELNAIIAKLEITDAMVCIHDFEVVWDPTLRFSRARYDQTKVDLNWDSIKFAEPYIRAVWFPLWPNKTEDPRGRVFLYMSISPMLPDNLHYLEDLGILKRWQ